MRNFRVKARRNIDVIKNPNPDNANVIKKPRKRIEELIHIGVLNAVSHIRVPWMGHRRLIDFIYHPANGGKRNAREAKRLQLMGVKPGVSDLHLFLPNGKYHGMFMEIKSPTGKLTKMQQSFLLDADALGFYTCITRSIDDGYNEILSYVRNVTNEECEKAARISQRN